jgi:hypothetical protein
MKEFLLLFRRPDQNNASPADMEALTKKWQEWLGNLSAQGKIVQGPVRLNTEGKVLKPGGVVTDGPFVEVKEMLGGFIVVRAADMEEATTLAHGCPVLTINGSVEIRTTMA